jgi:tetratricopeptide (TPR) repeat protein
MDQPGEAVHLWQEAVAVMNRLAEDYPLIVDQTNLAVSYHCLGRASFDARQYQQAAGYYRQAIGIREKMIRANPGNITHRSDIGGTWYRLGRALEQLQRREEALAAYQQASSHARLVSELQPTIVKHRQWLAERHRDIARLQRELGRLAEAAATSLQRKNLWPGNPVELYRVADELALCAALVAKDKATLSAEEQAERRRYAAQSLQALREAVSAGARIFLLFPRR